MTMTGKLPYQYLFQQVSDKYNMDANLDKIAKELYGKIQTRFPAIKIGDENANVLSKKEDIPRARFFEFEYEENSQPLGTITVTLDSDDGLIIQVSGDITNDADDSTRHGAFKFIRSFRQFAKDRLLNFDIQNIGKSNLDKRDYQFQAKRKEYPVMESKLFGTTKISYQDLGEARLIIKHSQPVNPDLPAGRTMHIENIYVENALGERFRYPFKHLNGARALAEHLKHGGNPYDSVGKYITGLSEELAQLRKFKGFVGRTPMVAETMSGITNKLSGRIDELKKEIHNLQKPTFYESFIESYKESAEQVLPEDIINDLVDRLTIRTFNEELKAAFPFIYKFIDESDIPVKELNADDLLDEEGKLCPVTGKRPCMCGSKKNEGFDPIAEFESFMEAIDVDDNSDKGPLFSLNRLEQTDAIETLNQIMEKELKGGPDGVNAIESLKGIIDDPDFLEDLQHIDPDLDVRPLIQQYITDTDPTIADRLDFNGAEPEEPEEEPAQPKTEPAPEPVPIPAEAPPVAPQGMATPQAPAAMPPMAESFSEDGLNEMLKYVSGFYNREHKNFPLGGERIKIKIKKEFEDGAFPNSSPEDLINVLKFIEKKDPSTLPAAETSVPDASPLSHTHNKDPRDQHLGEIMDEITGLHFNEEMESIIRLSGLK